MKKNSFLCLVQFIWDILDRECFNGTSDGCVQCAQRFRAYAAE